MPWVALSFVTKLVTVALHCPRLPSQLVTQLVTSFLCVFGLNGCKLAFMQAPVWYLVQFCQADLISGVSRPQRMRPKDNCVFISAGTPFQ